MAAKTAAHPLYPPGNARSSARPTPLFRLVQTELWVISRRVAISWVPSPARSIPQSCFRDFVKPGQRSSRWLKNPWSTLCSCSRASTSVVTDPIALSTFGLDIARLRTSTTFRTPSGSKPVETGDDLFPDTSSESQVLCRPVRISASSSSLPERERWSTAADVSRRRSSAVSCIFFANASRSAFWTPCLIALYVGGERVLPYPTPALVVGRYPSVCTRWRHVVLCRCRCRATIHANQELLLLFSRGSTPGIHRADRVQPFLCTSRYMPHRMLRPGCTLPVPGSSGLYPEQAQEKHLYVIRITPSHCERRCG